MKKTAKTHPHFIKAYLHPGHPMGNKKSNKYRVWRYLTWEQMRLDLNALNSMGNFTLIETSKNN